MLKHVSNQDHGSSWAPRQTDLPSLELFARLQRGKDDRSNYGLLSKFSAGGLKSEVQHSTSGKALFQMLGMFAAFERSMIQERVLAGLARAHGHGTKSGRAIGRPRVSTNVERRIRKLRGHGIGKLKIARIAGCGVSTVHRVLSDQRASAGSSQGVVAGLNLSSFSRSERACSS